MLARKIQLQDKKNNLEYQITALNTKKDEMISYASILSQDSITMSDIASLPTSLFSQGMADLTNAHYQALQITQAQYGQASASGMFGQPGSNPQLEMIAQQKIYENARKQIQKQLQAQLNEKEKAAAARAARLQVQLTNTERELENVEQCLGKDAQNSVCSYGLRA